MPTGVAPTQKVNSALEGASIAAYDQVADIARQHGLRYRGVEGDYLRFDRIESTVIDRPQALDIAVLIYRSLTASNDPAVRHLVDVLEGIRVA
jgi:hypothetical protein